MTTLRNVYACLVHERQECVLDLVRNLSCLDPDSLILIYNGGKNSGLISDFPFERYGAVLHPRPRAMAWGTLHEFALDCMRFALENFPIDILTIVDSDQLVVRPGYSGFLSQFLVDKTNVGWLGNAPRVQPPNTKVGPAAAAFRERNRWRGFLRGFPDGEQKFVHWTFWPSTIFTADAARDLVDLYDHDPDLKALLRSTKIWATGGGCPVHVGVAAGQ